VRQAGGEGPIVLVVGAGEIVVPFCTRVTISSSSGTDRTITCSVL
jgi:hypothetical protein